MTIYELHRRITALEEENELFYRALGRIAELPDEELQTSADFMRKVAKDALDEYFRRLWDGGEAL